MPYTNDERLFFELLQTSHGNKKILIEGDSWVSHPLLANLCIQMEDLGKGDFNILNMAAPGDTSDRMLNKNGAQYKKLKQLLDDDQHGWDFDLIFISAAGNDIVGPEVLSYVDDKDQSGGRNGKELLNQTYHDALDAIEEDYITLIELRNSGLTKDTPIATHCYSYLEPRQVGTKLFGRVFGKGWIDVYLEEKNIIDPDEKLEIVTEMLTLFKERLANLQANYANFIAVDTLGVLSTDGSPNTEFWHDEIHPNSKGFKMLANTIKEQCINHKVWPT